MTTSKTINNYGQNGLVTAHNFGSSGGYNTGGTGLGFSNTGS